MSTPGPQPGARARRAGMVLTGLVCLLLAWSAAMKILLPPGVPEHFAELGWPLPVLRGVAALELACAVIHLWPPTSVLGALLATAYLGGATAAHVRIGDGVSPFPAAVGLLLWLGLWLRQPALRAFLPLRRRG